MFRTFAAGAALVGTLTLAPAAVAGAQTPRLTAATASQGTQSKCEKAEALLAEVQQHETKVNDRITALEARVARLRERGKDGRADVLQHRIDVLKDRVDHVEARVAKLEARIEAKCGATVPPSTQS